MMSWIFLLLAILFEVAGTICMKLSEGFTKWLPSLLIFILYGLSLGAMVLSLKKIEISVVYAIWSGLGTALITVAGFLWFHEPVTAFKIISIGLIIIGVVGLEAGTAAVTP